jgi:hypothetical protein
MAGQGIENSTAELGAGLSQSDERAIVEALARVAVDDAAPEEGPLFGPMTDAYYDPKRGTPSGSKSDEMLGFGVDAAAAVVLVTPVALEVATKVLGYVVGELQTAFKDEAKPMIQALVKRVLGRSKKPEGDQAAAEPAVEPAAEPAVEPVAEPAAAPQMTQAQLDELRKVALSTAERMGLREPKASVLADAIVGAMVL